MRRAVDGIRDASIQRPALDRLLRFDRRTEARYEAKHGRARAAHLRHTIIFGILLYILHDISTYLLLPDHYRIVVLSTLFVIVPCSLAAAYGVSSKHLVRTLKAGGSFKEALWLHRYNGSRIINLDTTPLDDPLVIRLRRELKELCLL